MGRLRAAPDQRESRDSHSRRLVRLTLRRVLRRPLVIEHLAEVAEVRPPAAHRRFKPLATDRAFSYRSGAGRERHEEYGPDLSPSRSLRAGF